MSGTDSTTPPSFRVIDALDHPHGGRILRVRTAGGTVPKLRELRGSRIRARSPRGEEAIVRVVDFPVTGGQSSDRSVTETGRLDLLVMEEGAGPPVSITWELHLLRER